jgi:hypothetical protein
MKPKTAVFLLALLVVLLGVILVSQFERGRQVRQESDALWASKLGTVTQLTLRDDKGGQLAFRGKDDGWEMTEPLAAAAQKWAVDRLAEVVSDPHYVQKFSPDEKETPSPALTGLDKPRWTLAAVDDKGDRHELLVGKAVPLSGGKMTYVRPEGSTDVYVVELDAAGALGRPASDYRDKQVLNFDPADVEEVTVAGAERLDLTQSDGLWHVTQPVVTGADGDQVQAYLSRFSRLSTDKFVDDKPASLRPYGLEPGSERLVVQLRLKAESAASAPAASAPAGEEQATRPAPPQLATTQPAKTIGLALGGQAGTDSDKRYARLLDSPSVFLVRASLLGDLQATLSGMRDKQVMPVAADQVVGVQLDLPAGRGEFVRDNDTWRMKSPYEGPANGDAIENLLSEINALRAEQVRDDIQPLAQFGLERPVGTVTIDQAGRSAPRVLQIGSTSPSGEMTFLRCASENTVAVVKTASAGSVLADPVCYWATRILKVPDDMEINAISLDLPSAKLQLARQEGRWRVTSPLESPASDINVAKLLSKVADLSAEKIVALGPDGPGKYAGAGERIELALTASARPAPATSTAPASSPASAPAERAPSAEQHVYKLVLVKQDGQTYAWSPDATDPMVVGQCHSETWDAVTAELRDRQVWQMDPGKVTAFSVEAGTRRLDMVKQDKGWQCTGDPFVAIDPRKVDGFLASISRLDCEKFVTYAPAGADEKARYGLDEPWLTLTVTSDDQSRSLAVASGGEDRQANRYAVESGTDGVLLISGDLAGKLAVKLDDFQKQ